MAKNHTQYLFSMGELKRKDNSIDFYNSKGHNYISIEDLKEILFRLLSCKIKMSLKRRHWGQMRSLVSRCFCSLLTRICQ